LPKAGGTVSYQTIALFIFITGDTVKVLNASLRQVSPLAAIPFIPLTGLISEANVQKNRDMRVKK
jgi:hypothetical protein